MDNKPHIRRLRVVHHHVANPTLSRPTTTTASDVEIVARVAPDVISACRDRIESQACCVLPDFLPPATLDGLWQEAVHDLFELTHQTDGEENWGTAYSDWVPDSPAFGPDHPRHLQHKTCVDFVGYSSFPATSILRRLYESSEMEELVSALVGERMYRCVDTSRSLNLSVMRNAGDTHGWHYDTNTAVVSLVLEAPRAGGEFEWAPYSRNEVNENYDEMIRIFDGSSSRTRRYAPRSGDLVCFKGRRSVHRVAELQAGQRVVALLSYANEPNFYWKHLKPTKDSPDPSYVVGEPDV
eukprot:COSAG02_NODE_155_length_33066_cov_32.167562_33_plen_296_part_00